MPLQLIPTGRGLRHTDTVQLDPVVVELRDAQGTRIAPWLGHELQVEWNANRLPRATLPVILTKGFLVNEGTPANPQLKPVHEAIADDTIVTIRTARQEPESDDHLFAGYPEQIRYGAAQGRKHATLALVHIGDILAKGRDYQVLGQLRLPIGELQTWVGEPEYQPKPRLFEGVDCIFNPDGRGNCYANLVALEYLNAATEEAEQVKTCLFADPATAGAQHWSWLRVLVYLAVLARITPEGKLTAFTPFDFAMWNLWQIVFANPDWLAQDPHALPATPPEEAWQRVLLGKPKSHALDGMSWLEAWDWTCARAGVGYVWEARWDVVQQRMRWGIRIFPPGTAEHAGEPNEPQWIELFLPGPDYTVHNKSWEQILADANVGAFQIIKDYAQTLNETRVVGAAIQYEVTVELLPMWPADEWWDVDPADPQAVQAALARIGSESWNARYQYQQILGNQGAYWKVGRLWGLNTVGEADGFGRPWPAHPYHAAIGELENIYAWFDLAAVEAGEVQSQPKPPVFKAGQSALRRRPFQHCASGRSQHTPMPPVIEVSFDAGTTWKMLTAGVQVLRRDALIYLEADDLATLLSDAGETLPAAYIQGTLRLRITAGLDGDQSLVSFLTGSAISLSFRQRHRLDVKRGDFLFELREAVDDFSGGNSQFKGSTAWANIGRRHGTQIQRLAEENIRRFDRILFRGPVEIPWLVFPVIYAGQIWAGPRPGDMVVGIVAEAGQANRVHDLMFTPNQAGGGGIVAGVEWEYKSGARGAPPAAVTRIRIEDASEVVNA